MSTRTAFVFTALSFVTAAACTTDVVKPDTPSGGKGDDADGATPVTELELADFIEHGRKEIARVFALSGGEVPDTIWFQDGAGSMDLEPVFDHARLILVADIPDSAAPEPGVDVAYYAGLNGSANTTFVRVFTEPSPQVIYFERGALALVTDAALGTPEVDELVGQLRMQYPGATIQYLASIGALTFAADDFVAFKALFHSVDASDLIARVTLEQEVYRLPFAFDPAVAVDRRSVRYDVAAATTLTKELRAAKVRFATTPSLPPPFGPGTVSGDASWPRTFHAVVADEVVAQACADEAAAIVGVTIDQVLPTTGIFGFTAITAVARQVEALDCVIAIEEG